MGCNPAAERLQGCMYGVTANEFELRILGPIEARLGERRLPLAGRRQRTVLARLAIDANRVVAADRLVEAGWGDAPPAGVRNTLQGYVARLRRTLPAPAAGNRIETAEPGYVLHLGPQELDASVFENALAEGRRAMAAGRPAAAADVLDRALARWRGSPLADLGDFPWLVTERARLEERRLEGRELLVEARLAAGQLAATVAAASALTEESPLRERGWELEMLALYRAGRQADALAAYHRVRRLLAEELGVDPGPGLRSLEERILQQDPSLLATGASVDAASTAARHSRPHRLPVQRTSFVGREAEMAVLAGHLREAALVSVVGVGGSGKTRLALELASRLENAFGDGAWLVSLEGITDADSVARAAAEALGVREEPGRPLEHGVADAIGDRELLLVLDNCEHLLDGVAALVAGLLTACPRLRVLATSREPLAIAGELVFGLPPLAVPDRDDVDAEELVRADAAKLFLARARSAAPGFTLHPDHVPDLLRLLRRLDGLPLAVELAATRVRALGLRQILRQLERPGGDLQAGGRVGPERQRSIGATVAWSYRLLTQPERELLGRLSVFGGSFDLEAATAICSDAVLDEAQVVELIVGLVDRSLVIRTTVEAGEGGAYRLLDTIRRFAGERLAEGNVGDAVRDRHAAYFTRLARRAEAELRGPDQHEWAARLDEVRPDLSAALTWSLAHRRLDDALWLAASLRVYWEMRGHVGEGLGWLRRALQAAGDAPSPARANALIQAADLATGMGDHRHAEALLAEACRLTRRLGLPGLRADMHHVNGILGKYQGQYRRARVHLRRSAGLNRRIGRRWHLAQALHHLGMVMGYQGRYAEARRFHAESLELDEQLGDADSRAAALRAMSVVAIDEGQLEEAARLAQEAMTTFERLGSVLNAAHARYTLGDVARLGGRLVEADALYEESIPVLRAGGDRRCVASTLRNRGLVALGRSSVEEAQAHLRESLALRLDLDDRAGVAETFEGLAALAARRGETASAARLYGAAAALRAAIGSVRSPREATAIAAAERRLRRRMGPAAFDHLRGEGSAMNTEEAAALAATLA